MPSVGIRDNYGHSEGSLSSSSGRFLRSFVNKVRPPTNVLRRVRPERRATKDGIHAKGVSLSSHWPGSSHHAIASPAGLPTGPSSFLLALTVRVSTKWFGCVHLTMYKSFPRYTRPNVDLPCSGTYLYKSLFWATKCGDVPAP